MDNTKEGDEIIQRIYKMFPLACEYETDAREVWPKRWGALCNELEHALAVKRGEK